MTTLRDIFERLSPLQRILFVITLIWSLPMLTVAVLVSKFLSTIAMGVEGRLITATYLIVSLDNPRLHEFSKELLKEIDRRKAKR